MTTITLRFFNDHVVVTGANFEPMKFKSRLEAKEWCRPDRSRRMVEGSMGRPRQAAPNPPRSAG